MLRDRENVYKLLSASTHDNTQKNHSLYTIDPKTRYQSLDVKKVTNLENLTSLYDTDDLSADMTLSSPLPQKRYVLKKKTAVERRKSGGSKSFFLILDICSWILNFHMDFFNQICFVFLTFSSFLSGWCKCFSFSLLFLWILIKKNGKIFFMWFFPCEFLGMSYWCLENFLLAPDIVII